MKHRWTMKELEKASDNDILKSLVAERKSALNPYAPLAKRLSEVYENLDTEPSPLNVLTRLTEKVSRANSIHLSGGRVTREDWDELHMLKKEAKVKIQKAKWLN